MSEHEQDDATSRESHATEGVTRRALFQGAGAAAATGALFGRDAWAKDAPAAKAKGVAHKVQGPEAVSITLQVNGKAQALSVQPRETLLDTLRLGLDLTGAKPVCDRGQCGACTILMDDLPVYACTVLSVEAEGKTITTVEGLGGPTALHPVQKSFVEHDALQCGFCTPGMVVSCAYAVKTHGASLTEEQARAACAGNLCRCGTYPHVLKAALAAAKKGG